MLAEIKKFLDIPFVPKVERPFAEYDEVPQGMGCPKCGEARIDQLLLDDETHWPDSHVDCQTCGHHYVL